MNFPEVDQRYATLRQEYQAGRLTAEAFDEQLKSMMVQDSQGRWWAKSREKGEWHYYDLSTSSWLRADPPLAPATPVPNRPVPSPQTGTPQVAASQSAQLQPTRPQPTAQASTTAQTSAPAPRVAEPAAGAPAQAAGQSAAGQTPATSMRARQWGIAPLPELGAGLKFVYYVISFLIPIVGILLYFVYRGKPAPEDRAAARICLILGVVSLLLFGSCTGIGLLATFGV